jgi:hypothetical protein
MTKAGIDGAVPKEGSVVIAQSSVVDQPDKPVVLLTCTAGSKAELWVSYHPSTLKTGTDQAVIWVISSDIAQIKQLLNWWKDLRQDWIPTGYGGDKTCAKYFMIGAMRRMAMLWPQAGPIVGHVNLSPGLNMADDLKYKLSGAVVVSKKQESATLKAQIDSANKFVGENFAIDPIFGQSWDLKYEDLPEA